MCKKKKATINGNLLFFSSEALSNLKLKMLQERIKGIKESKEESFLKTVFELIICLFFFV